MVPGLLQFHAQTVEEKLSDICFSIIFYSFHYMLMGDFLVIVFCSFCYHMLIGESLDKYQVVKTRDQSFLSKIMRQKIKVFQVSILFNGIVHMQFNHVITIKN